MLIYCIYAMLLFCVRTGCLLYIIKYIVNSVQCCNLAHDQLQFVVFLYTYSYEPKDIRLHIHYSKLNIYTVENELHMLVLCPLYSNTRQ